MSQKMKNSMFGLIIKDEEFFIMSKDVQIKFRGKDGVWEELFPATKSRIVTTENGQSLEEVLTSKADVSFVNNTVEDVVVDVVEDVSGKLELKANKKQADWITPTLLNDVENTPTKPVRFMKDEFGFVHLGGRLTNVVVREHMFVLPTEYRPPFNLDLVGNGGGGTHAMISITTTGVVSVLSGTTTYITLDGISFYAGGD